jgi:hypothetical protein
MPASKCRYDTCNVKAVLTTQGGVVIAHVYGCPMEGVAIKPTNQFTFCTICTSEMVGTTEAHCAHCHRTFTSAYAFDLHWADALAEGEDEAVMTTLACVDPEKLSFVPVIRKSEATGGIRLVWATGHASQKSTERIGY